MKSVLYQCRIFPRQRLVICLIAILAYSLIPLETAGSLFGKSSSFSGRYVKQVDPRLPLMPRAGDLNAIKRYGILRVLMSDHPASEFEARLLQGFADRHSLQVLYINIGDQQAGRDAILQGHGDVLLRGDIDDDAIAHTFAFNTHKQRGVTWGIRNDNPQLRDSLNHQINRYLISMGTPDRYQEDLSGMKSRKALRVAMRADPNNYFLKDGRPVGFEYELLKTFAKQQGLWLDVIIVKSEREMVSLLKSGRADLASLSDTENTDPQIKNSLPFNPAENLLITGKSGARIKMLDSLNGKIIAIHDRDLSEQSMEKFLRLGLKVSVLSAEEGLEFDKFLERVSSGQYDVALVSARKYLQLNPTAKNLRILGSTDRTAFKSWGFNARHGDLAQALNSFVAETYMSSLYNFSYKKYHPEDRLSDAAVMAISPYDHLVRKYAAESQFDWRLISAQMYQESQFKPDARSVSGARGLMQIMPRTAREVGLRRVDDPERSIEAGIKYMKKLRTLYGDQLEASERNWFTLASYNAGFERIEDARRFAKKLGLDPNRWFGNVEYAMQKLADRKNRKHTRFGGCHCGQTVVYVRSIKRYYNSYVQLTDPVLVAASEPLTTQVDALTDSESGPLHLQF